VKLNDHGVIADWLLKVIAALAIVGVIMFDAGSMMVNFFTLDSTAEDIATSITHSLANKEIDATQHEVELKAKELAKEAQVRLVRAELEADGTLHVKLRRTASTVVVRRIGPIEDWAKATANANASTS
jgi:Flp pilus assembly protein TadB